MLSGHHRGEGDAGGCGDRHRREMVGEHGVVTELAVLVPAPRIRLPVVANGKVVVTTGSERPERHSWRGDHLDGSRLVHPGCAVTQLTEPVVAPGVGAAVVADREAVGVAGGDGGEAHAGRNRDHHGRRLVQVCGVISQLAFGVVAPGIGPPVIAESQHVRAAGRQRREPNPGRRADDHGGPLEQWRAAIAELTRVSATPGVDRPVGQREGPERPCRHHGRRHPRRQRHRRGARSVRR